MIFKIIYKRRTVIVNTHDLKANLIFLKIVDFDEILGMDWLCANCTIVGHNERIMSF